MSRESVHIYNAGSGNKMPDQATTMIPGITLRHESAVKMMVVPL